MDLTSIQMTILRDAGNEAPVEAGGTDGHEADLTADSRIVAGQIVNRTPSAITNLTSNAK